MKKFLGFTCFASCLLLCVPAHAASDCDAIAGNLVANCGFETGDFTSWTLSGNDVPTELGNLYGVEGTDPFDGIGPHSGSSQAYFGDLDANATTLSQAIATIPTDQYTVSFFLVQDTPPVTSPYSNEFSASFGGTSLVSLTAVPVEDYTEYSYTLDATSSSSLLSLTFGNDLGEFLLDDVSVVKDTTLATTPEPAAWTYMLAAMMGCALLWKRGLLTAR
jgi:hypothetical protein